MAASLLLLALSCFSGLALGALARLALDAAAGLLFRNAPLLEFSQTSFDHAMDVGAVVRYRVAMLRSALPKASDDVIAATFMRAIGESGVTWPGARAGPPP